MALRFKWQMICFGGYESKCVEVWITFRDAVDLGSKRANSWRSLEIAKTPNQHFLGQGHDRPARQVFTVVTWFAIPHDS